MQLKPITSLIDPGTVIARCLSGKTPTGYIAFVLNGELIQRRAYDMPWNGNYQTAEYIVLKKVGYALDCKPKPISGAFNVQSLKRTG